ncbi:hypothetical protein GPA19_00615 [Azoarcus indigens]|uniref:Uncharacterized protein n=1 Tax=Azoarcus indigens TaxID=29545 RepID=A0A4R6EFE5_9RHOO|nr:hypothetical protein [Azoarcus indigens]NMG63454.1 hypothetical protein [Azoarcus indigens]TDN57006.1 hypothetical protein C7389_101388 [Azoarcus indigens]
MPERTNLSPSNVVQHGLQLMAVYANSAESAAARFLEGRIADLEVAAQTIERDAAALNTTYTTIARLLEFANAPNEHHIRLTTARDAHRDRMHALNIGIFREYLKRRSG